MEGGDLGTPNVFRRKVPGEYRFRCAACGESVIVDQRIRNELLAEGCVVCSAPVKPNCFDPL